MRLDPKDLDRLRNRPMNMSEGAAIRLCFTLGVRLLFARGYRARARLHRLAEDWQRQFREVQALPAQSPAEEG